jgi:hypothetical protein
VIGDIISIISNTTGIIENVMEKAERGEQIDTAILAHAAEELEKLNERLFAFKAAAEAVDTDAEFAKLVRSEFTKINGG